MKAVWLLIVFLEEPKSPEEREKVMQGVQIVGGYDLKDGHLELAWLNDKITTTYANYGTLVCLGPRQPRPIVVKSEPPAIRHREGGSILR